MSSRPNGEAQTRGAGRRRYAGSLAQSRESSYDETRRQMRYAFSPFYMNMSASRKKLLTLLLVVALIAVIVMLDMRRRQAEEQLTKLSVRTDQVNSEQNKETAKRIVQRVGKLIVLPKDIEPTVATIVNIEALRSRNAFYNTAENGDYLLVTPTRAILYNDKRNIILDVAPVQVGPARPAAPTGSVTESAASSVAAQ